MTPSVRKSVSSFLIAASVLPLIASCGLPVDIWQEQEFDIDVPSGAEAPSEPKLIDFSQNDAVKDKLKQIQSLEISEIWLDITAVDPTNEADNVGGTISFSPADGTSGATVLGSYSKVPVADGAKFEITPDPAPVAQLQTLALTDHKFNISYQAAFSKGETPKVHAKFHLKARVHLVLAVGL